MYFMYYINNCPSICILCILLCRDVGLDDLSNRMEKLVRDLRPDNYVGTGVPPSLLENARPRARLDSDYDNVSTACR